MMQGQVLPLTLIKRAKADSIRVNMFWWRAVYKYSAMLAKMMSAFHFVKPIASHFFFALINFDIVNNMENSVAFTAI
jgi:hypothetical protein